MTVEIVEDWVNKLPRVERNQPLVIHGDRVYTPNEILAEVRAGTSLGAELQRIIEARAFTTVEEKYALAILRLKERLMKLPETYKTLIGEKIYTPSQLLEEIEKGTRIGRMLIEAEMTNLEEILKK